MSGTQRVPRWAIDIGDRVRRIDVQKVECPECGERFILGKWQSGDLNCAKKKPVDPSPRETTGRIWANEAGLNRLSPRRKIRGASSQGPDHRT
jgi:hypothetical protein